MASIHSWSGSEDGSDEDLAGNIYVKTRIGLEGLSSYRKHPKAKGNEEEGDEGDDNIEDEVEDEDEDEDEAYFADSPY